MDIFKLLTMIGGLAVFLYGMCVMGGGLGALSEGRLSAILESLTAHPIKGVVLGAIVTAIIQSSSATTVMVVGLVDSGIMKLSQAIGVIMGANIGTTITAWLLGLTGIHGSSLLVKMLKPSSFAPILAMTGVVFIMTGRREKMKEIGESLIGFSLLMFGMQTMSGAVEALADDPSFTGILTMFKNPIAGIMAGAILTAVIQSSSASIGILQALSVTGAFTYGSVIPIIMGQNIGTCATALLSSIGAGKGAKQAAFVHLYFNLIGSVIFMLTYYLFDIIFIFSFTDKTAGIAGIAAIHTIFNVFATVSLLPFAGALERLVKQ